jgi:hypothetical protein
LILLACIEGTSEVGMTMKLSSIYSQQ